MRYRLPFAIAPRQLESVRGTTDHISSQKSTLRALGGCVGKHPTALHDNFLLYERQPTLISSYAVIKKWLSYRGKNSSGGVSLLTKRGPAMSYRAAAKEPHARKG